MYATLMATLWPQTQQSWLYRTGMVALGVMLLVASSKIQIPLYPVPVTMQTFVLLVMSFAYGWRLAVTTVLCYFGLGALGLPVFSGTPEKGIGLAYMLGTTGGYLMGWLFAAGLCGYLAERGWDRHIITTAFAMLLANMVIYVPGLLWLGMLLGWDKPILAWGFTPFIIGDVFKLVLAAGLMPIIWRVVRKS